MAYAITDLRGTAIHWVKVRCSEFTIHECIWCRHFYVFFLRPTVHCLTATQVSSSQGSHRGGQWAK
jgi:hypothetical protein